MDEALVVTDAAGNRLEAYSFDYAGQQVSSADADVSSFWVNTEDQMPTIPLDIFQSNGAACGVRVLDVDDDGFQDILQINTVTEPDGTFATEGKLFRNIDPVAPGGPRQFVEEGPKLAEGLEFCVDGVNQERFKTGDFDGDGIDEVIEVLLKADVPPNGVDEDGPFSWLPIAFYDDYLESFPPTYFKYRGTDRGRFLGLEKDEDARNVIVTDYNGDGVLDVLFSQEPFDVNGNGQIDPEEGSQTAKRWAALGGPSGFEGIPFPLPLGWSLHSPAGDTGVRMMDFNGDGHLDFIRSSSFDGSRDWTLIENDGNGGWILRESFADPSTPSGFSDDSFGLKCPPVRFQEGLQIHDLNGDSYPDLVMAGNKRAPFYREGSRETINYNGMYWLGTGCGWRAVGFLPRTPSLDTRGTQTISHFSKFIDVNGDNLPDMLWQKTTAAATPIIEKRLFLQDPGIGWTEHAPDASNAERRAFDKIFPGFLDQLTKPLDFIDWNSDGQVDVYETNGQRRVFLSKVAKVDLLRSITDQQLGSIVEFNYKVLSEATLEPDSFYAYQGDWGDGTGIPGRLDTRPFWRSSNSRAALSQIVVTECLSTNGTGGTNSKDYRYGPAFVNKRGFGHLGFTWMETRDANTGIKATSYYNQTFPYVGMEVLNTVEDATGVIKRTTTEYEARNLGLKPVTPRIVFPSSVRIESFAEGGAEAEVVSLKESEIDAYGNVTRITTTVSAAGAIDTNTTTSEFLTDLERWHMGLPTRIETTSTRAFEGEVHSNTRLVTMSYRSEDAALLAEIVEPGSPTERTTSYDFDRFGNVIGKVVSGSDFAPRGDRVAYDPSGRFPVWKQNALGHQDYIVNDPLLGLPIRIKDANGLETSFSYDSLGRIIEEVRPDGSSTRVRHIKSLENTRIGIGGEFVEEPAYSIDIAFRVLEQSSGGPLKVTHFDRLARPVREERVLGDRRKQFRDTIYSREGWVVKQTLPYLEGTLPFFDTTIYTPRGTVAGVTPSYGPVAQISESALSRETTLTYPDGSQAPRMELQTMDGKGQLLISTDALGTKFGNDVGQVKNTYDAVGNLVKIIANGLTTRIDYDSFGRRTAIHDPNTGITRFRYNALNELIEQTDALGRVTRMRYDLLGRRIYQQTSDAVFHYVYDSAPGSGIGQLHHSLRTDGVSEEFWYDQLGRVEAKMQHIRGMSFTSSMSYDSFSRPVETTSPDGFITRNQFGRFGHLEQVRSEHDGIEKVEWRATAYDFSGQVSSFRLGNGIETTRVMNPENGLLTSITTNGPPGLLQSLSYTYNLDSNLSAKEDLQASASSNLECGVC